MVEHLYVRMLMGLLLVTAVGSVTMALFLGTK
jgi:hypothetical protein